MRTRTFILLLSLAVNIQTNLANQYLRHEKALSLFSIVQFPNQECTAGSSSTTYIRNPGYPSSYTASAGSCQFTFNKLSDDICQLRLDFQTFSGFVAATSGACTDSLAVA